MNQNEINISIINYLRPMILSDRDFWFFARKEQTPESDIDILVKFRKTISLLDLARIQRELRR
jgi:predicted nucleotidyltransferase